jgi:hypothetical protein
VHTPGDPQPRRSVRMDAALDEQTRGKLEHLAMAFHCSRAAVLRHVMRWGLVQRGPIVMRVPRHITSCFFMVDAALHRQVKAAATDAGSDVAPWLRHMMRQITRADFPKSWQARQTERRNATAPRSHDSRHYWKRFMLRLDDQAGERLEELASHFGEPHAEVVRRLIVQATLEDFPPSWHLAAEERLPRQGRRVT